LQESLPHPTDRSEHYATQDRYSEQKAKLCQPETTAQQEHSNPQKNSSQTAPQRDCSAEPFDALGSFDSRHAIPLILTPSVQMIAWVINCCHQRP
jgi:hypothetical protein